jgi:formylglycine-generating enzyme required for sulfatase activity
VRPDQIAEAARLGKPVAFEEPTTGMRFVLIPGGTFLMGSPATEEGRGSDETQHRVTLSPFYLAIHEVSNAQFRRFRPEHESRSFTPDRGRRKGKPQDLDADLQPVVSVGHDDALAFVRWLSERGNTKGYRLPSEAQWEYACRAGSTSARPWAGDLATGHEHGNGNDPEAKMEFGLVMEGWPKSDRHLVAAPVGSYRASAWGLHDMIGNVWEWCSDWMVEYGSGEAKDPEGPPSGTSRVLRGGSWLDFSGLLRAASRLRGVPRVRAHDIGFRVSLPVSAR